MKLRLSSRARDDAKRIDTWWVRNRPQARDLFEQELFSALSDLEAEPSFGKVYDEPALPFEVRRVLLPKTHTHVYYTVEGDEVLVLTIWGATRRRPFTA